MNADELWVGTMLDGEARWAVARTKMTVDEARRRHNLTPVATAALGRVMTGTLLLASSLKGEESVTARFLGDGPLGGLIAVGKAQGEVKGYVHEPLVDLPLRADGKLDVGRAVGHGELKVSRSLANGELYNGVVSIVSGEIAEDLVYYLLHSEQVPSAMLLGVLVEKDLQVAGAAGCLFQPFPGASEESISALEQRLESLQGGISGLAAGTGNIEEMIQELMGQLPYQVLERRPAAFVCDCSKPRLSQTLVLLGEKEIADLIADKEAEIVCHFCNEHYQFTEDELKDLLEQTRTHSKKLKE